MATTDKYDRQLRLWGANGQRLLGGAHVLLLGCGPSGTETLKNLVLPGVGQFTIVDEGVVSEADASNNFFLPREHVGRSRRAEVACELMCELNTDVHGSAVVADPVRWVSSCATLERFSICVACELDEAGQVAVERLLLSAAVPLVVARSMGFVGVVRTVLRSHCVVESKPSPAPAEDLRLANPFAELAEFCLALDLDLLDSKAFKHTPYVVVLLQQAAQWRRERAGALPASAADKAAFKERIRQLARAPWGEEENLTEALANAFLAFTVREVPPEVRQVLADPRAALGADPQDTAKPSGEFDRAFWVMARALREFVAGEGRGLLPVSGRLPDMTAATDQFVRLQALYARKAAQDCAAVLARVLAVLADLRARGLPTPAPGACGEEQVRDFCKNAYHLRALRFSAVRDETDPARVNRDALEAATTEGLGDTSPTSPALLWLMLKACDRVRAATGRYPGDTGTLAIAPAEARREADTLLAQANQIASHIGLQHALCPSLDLAQEFVRFAGVELHPVAAVIGGIASQEVVKLITHQYTPMKDLYVFNGITCSGAAFSMAADDDEDQQQ
jgi:amyloid beta precursor protein binding protein 1